MPRPSASQLLGRATLCGHDSATQKLCDERTQKAVLCGVCFVTVRDLRDRFMAGAMAARDVRAALVAVLGRREGRSYARELRRARALRRLRAACHPHAAEVA